MQILKKSYDVIISAQDVTKKVLLLGSNQIVDVVMRPKVSNIAILWEKLPQRQFYKDLTRKNIVFV